METKKTQKTEISHLQLLGWTMYDQVEDSRFLKFEPAEPTPGLMSSLKRRAMVTQLSDGAFEVSLKPCYRSRAKEIVKLPHGRLSETKDEAYLLTIKIPKDNACIAQTMKDEALQAVVALIRKEMGV